MDAHDFAARTAFHELLDTLRDLDRKFFEGPNALGDEQSVLEGYKWIPSILAVGPMPMSSMTRPSGPVPS